MLKKGFTQIFLVLGLALVVLTIPLTVRLLKERQETRKMAREDLGCGTCEKQVTKRECRTISTPTCEKYKEKCETKTKYKCDPICIEENCTDEEYPCKQQVCIEYNQECTTKYRRCKVDNDPDTGAPIFDDCPYEDCHNTSCKTYDLDWDTCTRQKCSGCKRWDRDCRNEQVEECHQTDECEIAGQPKEEQVCENVSACEPDLNCLAEASTPPATEPPSTEPPSTQPPQTTPPSTNPPASNLPSSCNNGEKECNDSGGYNECLNGSWYSQSCPNETICSGGNCLSPNTVAQTTATPEPTIVPSLTATPYKTQYMLMREAYCQEHQAECKEIEKMQQQNVETAKTAAIVIAIAVPVVATAPLWAPEAAAVIATGGPALVAISAGPTIQTAGLVTTRVAATALADAIIMKLGNQAYQEIIRPYLTQPEISQQLQAIPEPLISRQKIPISSLLPNQIKMNTPWIIAVADYANEKTTQIEPVVGQVGMTLATAGPLFFYGGKGLTDIRNQQTTQQKQQNQFILDVGGPSLEKNQWFYPANPRININIHHGGIPIYDEFSEEVKIISVMRGENQITGNALALPLANNSIPVYSSNCMMGEVLCSPLFAQEANRVLKPGGLIHVSGIIPKAVTPLINEMQKPGFKNLTIWKDLFGTATVTGYK